MRDDALFHHCTSRTERGEAEDAAEIYYYQRVLLIPLAVVSSHVGKYRKRAICELIVTPKTLIRMAKSPRFLCLRVSEGA